MARRNPVRWLMTDERMGEALWPALRALPPGCGVVFRHYATPPAARRALLRQVKRIATARRLVLSVADGGNGKAAVHGLAPGGTSLRTASAHGRREARRAVRAGATLLFVSPVYATRSHPGARAAGPLVAARFGAGLGVAIIALGGMDERRWRRIRWLGFDGWAAIDAWVDRASRQKRNTVPT